MPVVLDLEAAHDAYGSGLVNVPDTILKICCDVLKLDRGSIDPTKSFLLQGGDSLLALKVMARCRMEGIGLTTANLVKAKTIAELCTQGHVLPLDAKMPRTIVMPVDSDSSRSSSPTEYTQSSDHTSVALQQQALPESTLDKLKNLSSPGNFEIESVSECSSVQERLLASQLATSQLYQCGFVLKFDAKGGMGTINSRRLSKAWQHVVQRHGALRTVFIDHPDGRTNFRQVVLRNVDIDIKFFESSKSLATQATTQGSSIVFTTFELPHRMCFVQTSKTQIYAKLEISHAVMDGLSGDIILRDWCQAYSSQQPLAPAPSYIDGHIQIMEQTPAVPLNDDHDMDMLCSLPMDNSHNPMATLATVSTKITCRSSFKKLQKSLPQVTMANVCQLAWALVLRCATSSNEVAFSYAESGRSSLGEDAYDIVGPFVESQLCRISFKDDTTLREELSQLIQLAEDVSSGHQPNAKSLGAGWSVRQICNTTMSFQPRVGGEVAQDASFTFELLEKYLPTDYDVAIYIGAGAQDLVIDLDYWSSRLDESRAQKFLRMFQLATEYVLANLEQKTAAVNLMPPEDLDQIRSWNTKEAQCLNTCLHDEVAKVVRQKPTKVAIEAFDGSLTYQELFKLSEALARRLQTEKVGKETAVGLCMSKSKWAIVAMLGILMAGGVVVPLGIVYPTARIETLVKQVNCSIVLVDESQNQRLASLSDKVKFVRVTEETMSTPQPKSGIKLAPTRPDQAAWIIFTSGTTGVPKAVVLEHRSLATGLKSHAVAFQLGEDTRASQFSSFTFDMSITDIFMTLMLGGCVCVFSEEDRSNDLAGSLQRLNVNTTFLTPTVLKLLAPDQLPGIKTVLSGGEPLDKSIVEKWSGKAKIFNAYGPSECCITAACAGPVTDSNEAANVGFGTSCRLWVTNIDNPHQLCPIGVQGELLIEGPIVFRGYFNNASSSSKALVENDFLSSSGVPGKPSASALSRRMYRTGDLVRQNADGSVTHLGRRDTQLKIRGQRIEVGEIEHWILQSLPQARNVAVVLDVRESQKDNKTLVAVIEYDTNDETFSASNSSKTGKQNKVHLQPLETSESIVQSLRATQSLLHDNLPPHMVPNVFLPVCKLPVNPSLKVDRGLVTSSLSKLDLVDLRKYLVQPESLSRPFSESETSLRILWASTLDMSTTGIGLTDNFFHLGGDSVSAMRLVSKARNEKLSITVSDIHDHPRLDELAAIIASRQVDSVDVEIPVIAGAEAFSLWQSKTDENSDLGERLELIATQCGLTPAQIQDVYPASPLQEALLALTIRQPEAYTNVSIWSIEAGLELSRFQHAWQTVIARNAILRTRLLTDADDVPIQVVEKAAPEWREATSLEDYLQAQRIEGMAPGQALNRFAMIRQVSGELYFVWTSHHSSYDGWSKEILLTEVADLYYRRELRPTVPPNRFISYLLEADVERTTKYWQEQLQGDLGQTFPQYPTPTYQPRPRKRSSHTCPLPSTQHKNALAADILRAAWALTVSQYIGNNRPTFAVALSGRDIHVDDVTEMAAPTFTTVPVAVDVDTDLTVIDFLRNVRRQAVSMIPFAHTGLTKIRQLVGNAVDSLDLRHLFVVQASRGVGADRAIAEAVPVEVAISEFDSYALNVECIIDHGSIELDVRFDEDVMTPGQIARLMDQFGHNINQLHDERLADVRICDLEMSSAQNMATIKGWNEVTPQGVERCLHELVSEIAARQPRSIAVEAWDGTLMYRSFERATDQLASMLISQGVKPEVPVGVCMGKSMFALIAFQAVLKSGGIVVPLGVNHPPARVQELMFQVGADFLLYDAEQKMRLGDFVEEDVVTAVVDQRLLDSLPNTKPKPVGGVQPTNAAWIVFTSGSTGTPKAAVLEHRALATSIVAQGDRFGFDTSSRTLQFAAHVFDVAIRDCFTTLVHGGTVCIPSEEQRMNGVAAFIADMQVNTIGCTSTVASLLEPAKMPSLHTMILAGEPAQASTLELWYKHVDIINAYGIAECSIDSCSTYKKRSTTSTEAAGIGYGLATRIWIVDPANPNRLSPIGAPGEIVVEGATVGRGYLNNKTKTTQVFISAPAFISKLGLQSDHRFYRTGDMGCQLEDGSFIHVGRMDTQIKIRGQRVDVGEIEYWIGRKHPHASRAAVIPQLGGPTSRQGLLALIELPKDNDSLVIEQDIATDLLKPTNALQEATRMVQSDLLDVIPAYMIPGTFLYVRQLLQTPTGKLDRKAIAQMIAQVKSSELEACSVSAGSGGSTAPVQTVAEELLRTLWANTLGISPESIGRDNHFIQIGGDSVMAMRIVSAARAEEATKKLGLTVGDMFKYPRLADLAGVLESRMVKDDVPGNGGEEAESMEETDDEEPEPFSMLEEAMGL